MYFLKQTVLKKMELLITRLQCTLTEGLHAD